MTKLLLATLLGLGALASSHAVQAQSRSDVRAIEQEYAQSHGGQQISDNQLDYYLDQMGRGWSLDQVRQDISGPRGNPNNNGWRPREGWTASSVVCSSEDRRYHECPVPFRGMARLANQISDTNCTEGRTWGQKPGVVWVNGGCRARFNVGAGNGRPGYGANGGNNGYGNNSYGNNGGGDWNRNDNYMVTCASTDNRQTRCQWDERYGIPRINKQLSKSRCTAGQTWGYDDRDLWVSNGCRATFISNDRRR